MNGTQIRSNDLLPVSMQSHGSRTDWTPEWRSAVLACLLAGDELAVRDLLDTVADWGRELPLLQHVEHLIAAYSPSDVYSMWLTSSGWAAAVQHPQLSDLIGPQTESSRELQLCVSYWMHEHASPEQAVVLSHLVGQPELPEQTRFCGEIDPESIGWGPGREGQPAAPASSLAAAHHTGPR